MIEPTGRAKAYIAKLADALEVEGYSTDAKIVRESLKIMNGEKVPMATMDEESVSGDLEEAAKNYCVGSSFSDACMEKPAFIAGANWQKEQFEKNRLAACDAQTKEEAEREMDFVEKMIQEEHRQPTYSDAIEYGMREMKQQMMKDSIDATMEHMPNDYGEFRPCIHVKVDRSFKKGQKVKVIIIKEE